MNWVRALALFLCLASAGDALKRGGWSEAIAWVAATLLLALVWLGEAAWAAERQGLTDDE